MRTLVLVVLAACDGSSSGIAVDAEPGDAVAMFCDGTPHDVGQGIINEIAVDASGRLLAVGTQFTPAQTMFVRRLLATGEPDPAFGVAGVVTLDTAGALVDAHAIAVRADGTIIAGGGIESPATLRPFVVGFSDTGAPTGFDVRDPASQESTVDKIFTQGPALLVKTGDVLRRITAAGAFDASFGTNGDVFVGDGVAASDNGIVVATNQIDSFTTHRLTPDGQTVAGSAVSATADSAWDVMTAVSRADRITFVGSTVASGNMFHLVVGRVLADNTWDAAYPPNGIVDLGVGAARAAFERDDGSLLLAAYAAGILVVKPDGTIDRMIPIGSDPSKVNLTSVIEWNGHVTGAGTLAGGRAFVACFP